MVFRTTKALALAGILSVAAAGAQAQVLLNESFDNVAGLSANGWLMLNRSSPLGSVATWFQGDGSILPAMSGATNSYAASNFNAGTTGGSIADWLITPTFSTQNSGTVSFWIRGDVAPGFSDYFSYGLSSGGSNTSDFSLSTAAVVTGAWTQVTMSFTGTGSATLGRLAIVHVGLADIANYVGVDNVAVTAVPEPQAWLLMGLGLAGIGLVKSRRRAVAAA